MDTFLDELIERLEVPWWGTPTQKLLWQVKQVDMLLGNSCFLRGF
jgi:hypothetical protein